MANFLMSSIKLLFGDEMRRLSRPPPTFEELTAATERMYEVQHPVFSYQDEDKDWITIGTQAEYRGALDYAAGKILKLVVSLSDPGLSDSFIPVASNLSLLRSSVFDLRASQPNTEQIYQSLKKPEVKAKDPRGSLALDDEFKRSIRDAIREELSSMIIKPKAQSKEVFEFMCSNCHQRPISSVIYVCLYCPNGYWCEGCEEVIDHEHALLKVKSASMMQQVTAHTMQMLASQPEDKGPASIAARDLKILTERLEGFGFEINERTMRTLVKNRYDLAMTVEELLKEQGTN
jgi:hypothetical protein